ncbi:MAG: hypothetical protein GY940_16875 [bacterium]|nr:hypothetical protein [bacterium]
MTKQKRRNGKFLGFFKLIFRNLASMHRYVWGKGWKRVLLSIGVTLVLLVILLFGFAEVTSTPKFCSSCHIMEPYYESWKTSSHSHVSCTDCHFPPGLQNKIKGKFTAMSMLVNYFTGVYKRRSPRAEISDASCMREGCHETRTLSGQVDFKKGIIFDHAPHLTELRKGKKLRCTSCHSQIVQGSHISVTESSCFLCHFKGAPNTQSTIQRCTTCHNPPTRKNSSDSETAIPFDHTLVMERGVMCQKCHGNMVVGDGSVPSFRCSGCHSDVEKMKHFDDGPLMHKNHITDHKIECDQCHTEIQHKSVARSEWVKPDCNACHPDFHNAQLMLFSGKGGKGIPDHPSPMFESGLNCQACHLYHTSSDDFKEKGTVVIAGGESCESCHGKGYGTMIERWKGQTGRAVSRLSKILDTAKKELEKYNTKAGYDGARKKLEDAEYNYKLVKHGNSIHNIAFANQLMDKSYQLAKEGLKEVESSKQLQEFHVEEPITPGDCKNCHSELMNGKKVEVFGLRYSHDRHVNKQDMTCSRCHSNEQKHGQLVIGKQDCMSCHHQEKKLEQEPQCGNCHKTQQAVYFSRFQLASHETPNVMVEDVGCIDCHKDENDKIYRPGKTSCSDCHDAEYEEMFTEWRTNAQDLLKKLREKVQKEKLAEGHPAYDTLKMLEKDGSKGIHNPDLYELLIQEAMKK